MVIKIETKKIESLSKIEMDLMNVWMKKEFGKKYVRDFKKYYPGDALCFFVKDGEDIIAFGILNPVVLEYLGKRYDVFGMGDIVTIRRGEGYGKILLEAMVEYLKKSEKSGLGFCARKNLPFYEKVGLGIKEGLMKRFRYRDLKSGEVSKEKNGDGLFYSGKDGFIEKMLESDSLVYLDTELW